MAPCIHKTSCAASCGCELLTNRFSIRCFSVLSRSNSEGSLDETKALLSDDGHGPKEGQLELHMTSSSSGASVGLKMEASPKKNVDK